MLPKTQILTAILMAVAATGSAQAQIMDTPASHAVIMITRRAQYSSPRMARNP